MKKLFILLISSSALIFFTETQRPFSKGKKTASLFLIFPATLGMTFPLAMILSLPSYKNKQNKQIDKFFKKYANGQNIDKFFRKYAHGQHVNIKRLLMEKSFKDTSFKSDWPSTIPILFDLLHIAGILSGTMNALKNRKKIKTFKDLKTSLKKGYFAPYKNSWNWTAGALVKTVKIK